MADVSKTIEVTLKGKTGSLNKALSNLDSKTDKTGKKIADDLDKAFKKASKSAKKNTASMIGSFKKLKKGAAGAAIAATGVALALAAGSKAVFDFARSIGDLTNQLADASARSGLTIQQLQSLSLALEGSGLSLQQMEPALDKFPLQLKKAADGSKKMEAAFKRVGVSVKTTDGELRETNVVFQETLEGLKNIDNTAEKAATAMELFGKQGGMLIQSGAIEGMEAFNALVKEFGVNTGEAAVKEAANMQRALADLKVVAQGTGQALLKAFVGEDTQLSDIIDRLSFGVIRFGVITEDVAAIIKGQFKVMQIPIGTTALLLEGRFADAAAYSKKQLHEMAMPLFNLTSTLERAENKVWKFALASRKARTAGGGSGGGGGGSGGGGGEQTELEEQVDLEALKLQLKQLQRAANADLLTAEEKIVRKMQDQLAALDDLAAKSEGQLDVEQTTIDILMQMEREKHALKMENAEKEAELKEKIAEKELNDALKNAEKIAEANRAAVEATLASALTISTSLAEIADNQIAHIENRKEKGLEIIEHMERSGQLTAQAAAKQRQHLEQDTAKKIEEASMRAFNIKKGTAIATAMIDAISASVRAFADYPFPQSALISAAAGAAAVAQIAAIQSQPPPTFDIGGMVGNRDPLAPDAVNANLLSGEAVLSRQDVRNIGGPAGLKRLQNGGGSGGVVVISPFKHFDKFINSSLKRPSRLRSLIGSNSTGSTGY